MRIVEKLLSLKGEDICFLPFLNLQAVGSLVSMLLTRVWRLTSGKLIPSPQGLAIWLSPTVAQETLPHIPVLEPIHREPHSCMQTFQQHFSASS